MFKAGGGDYTDDPNFSAIKGYGDLECQFYIHLNSVQKEEGGLSRVTKHEIIGNAKILLDHDAMIYTGVSCQNPQGVGGLFRLFQLRLAKIKTPPTGDFRKCSGLEFCFRGVNDS